MRRATVLLALLLLGGCAASKYVSSDPEAPKQVCEHTMEGTQAKEFCY